MALLAKAVLTGRVHDRRPVRLDGTLRVDDKPFDVVIHDLSVSGFRARTNADLQPGDRVAIGSPAIPLREAVVVWARVGEVGFEFVNPLRAFEVAAAEPLDTVVQFSTGDICAPPGRAETPEPAIEKWPKFLRAAFIIGSSLVLWGTIIALLRLL
jgi:PilZ domain